MSMHPMLLPAAILALIVGAFASRMLLAIRSERRQQQRRVEAPNSHYDPVVVRNMATRQRWADIRLDQVHEVNRGEVERLLNKSDVIGVDALKPAEKQFLDVMRQISRAEG